jgi:hypothetical protein
VKLRFLKINLAGVEVNQAAGHQLAITRLDNVGSITTHNPICRLCDLRLCDFSGIRFTDLVNELNVPGFGENYMLH